MRPILITLGAVLALLAAVFFGAAWSTFHKTPVTDADCRVTAVRYGPQATEQDYTLTVHCQPKR